MFLSMPDECSILTHITEQQKMKLLAKYNYQCAGCRTEIDYSPRKPEIHHVDNDPSNNEQSNTIPYCRDCHKMANTGLTAEQIKDLLDTFNAIT
jgi:hypothetical protein